MNIIFTTISHIRTRVGGSVKWVGEVIAGESAVANSAARSATVSNNVERGSSSSIVNPENPSVETRLLVHAVREHEHNKIRAGILEDVAKLPSGSSEQAHALQMAVRLSKRMPISPDVENLGLLSPNPDTKSEDSMKPLEIAHKGSGTATNVAKLVGIVFGTESGGDLVDGAMGGGGLADTEDISSRQAFPSPLKSGDLPSSLALKNSGEADVSPSHSSLSEK